MLFIRHSGKTERKEVIGMYKVDEKELQKFCDIQDDYRWFITDESLNEFLKDPMDDLFKDFEKKMELERLQAEEYDAYLREISII